MTLRVRLIILVTAIVGLLFVTSYSVVTQHRSGLMRSLDESLTKASKDVSLVIALSGQPQYITTPFPGETSEDALTEGSNLGQTVLPISDVSVSVVFSNGSTFKITQGPIDGDKANLKSIDFSKLSSAEFLTSESTDPGESIRLLVSPVSATSWLVAWRGLGQAEAEVSRLAFSIYSSVTAVAILLLVMLLWVFRLGLRPIELVTEAANSVISGGRSERLPRNSKGTEADRLSEAFNLMVDQRDKAEKTLRQFVADASHELRTPLTSFEGLLELIQKEKLSAEKTSDILRRLRNESKRMKDLVENLLLLANLDEGQPLRREKVDVRLIAEDAVSDLAILHPKRKISFAPETLESNDALPSGQLYEAASNEQMIHQVLAGLLKNAIVHTPETAEIRVSVAREGNQVKLQVSDNGPGISDDLAESVFQRFVRGDQSRARTESQGGFGLGLAIARSIVEALGGTLTLESTVGVGSAFTISIPASTLDHSD